MSEDQVDLRQVAFAVATIFLLAGALTVTDWIRPLNGGGSNTWQITASIDDVRRGRSTSDGDFFYTDSIGNPAGFVTSTFMAQGVGLRYHDINIPQGSTINSAHLNMCSRNAKSGVVVRSNITANDVDNATVFSDMADYDGRVHTSNYTHWDSIPGWSTDVWYLSPDFKAVVQEVIDRAGWVSGNSIIIFWDDHDDRSTQVSDAIRVGYSWDNTPSKTPILSIEWGGDSAPTFSQASHNTTVAGCPCNFSCLVSDDVGLSKGKVETNNTGTYTNSSFKSLSGTSDTLYDTLTLNSTVSVFIRYRFHANDSTDQWAASSWHNLTTTGGGVLGKLPVVFSTYREIRFSCQRKTFFAQNRHWVFYGNHSSGDLELQTSTNGICFGGVTNITSINGTFALWNNDTHVALAVDKSDDTLQFRMGELNSTGTIDWLDDFEAALDETGAGMTRPNINVDQYGYPWVIVNRLNLSADTRMTYVARSQWNNGSWSTASGFPDDIGTISWHAYRGMLIELEDVGMYAVWYIYSDRVQGRLWNYTSEAWESVETGADAINPKRLNAAVDTDNMIHIIVAPHGSGTTNIYYMNRSSSGFGSTTLIGVADTAPPYRGETVTIVGLDVYLFWRNTSTTIISKNYTAGSWGDSFVWKTTSSTDIYCGMQSFLEMMDNKIGFAWTIGTGASTYSLKYDFFMLSTNLTTGWNSFYAWTFDVGHTLGEVNASIWADNVEFSVFTLEFANGTQVSFWRDSIANAGVEVEAVTDTFWVYCTVAGEWKHSY